MQGDIKMSKLASCGGCGAKVGAGMLSQILQGMKTCWWATIPATTPPFIR